MLNKSSHKVNCDTINHFGETSLGYVACPDGPDRANESSSSTVADDPNSETCPVGEFYYQGTCQGPPPERCEDSAGDGTESYAICGRCSDGADNDGDGLADSSDTDCNAIGEATPTPTPSYEDPCSATRRRMCIESGGQWSYVDCDCKYPDPASPVLIDTSGDGFALTDAPGGVDFDIDNDGAGERISWTAFNSDDAWLALDRDGDGAIESGAELFGNYAPQPEPPAGRQKNGFLALAEFDRPESGGNGDGLIDGRDSVFSSLRLWRDANHDGVSQPEELHAPESLRVASFPLDYKEVRRRDRHGNEFRYQAPVSGTEERTTRRLAYDVFLVTGR